MMTSILPLMLLLQPATTSVSEGSGGPYCGIFCVYTAATMLGKPSNLEDLIQSEHVGSHKRSTIGELEAAIRKVGLTPTAMSGLTTSILRESPHPILLHVRRPGTKMPYAHWILYAGDADGKARIIDPPAGVELVSFAEVASLWDGVGIVVSADPPDQVAFRVAAWTDTVVALVLMIVVLGLLWLTPLRRLGALPSAALLVVVGGTAGIVLQLGSSDGLLVNRAAVGQVSGQHFQPDTPIVEYDRVRELLANDGTMVIDARTRQDYAAGHLPKAVSLPIFSGLVERRNATAKFTPTTPVIVYCQSSGCTWSDALAADLYHRGHHNVVIYRGGWRDWSQHAN